MQKEKTRVKRFGREMSESAVFAYLESHEKQFGFMPTFKEIADHFAAKRGCRYGRSWADWIVRGLVAAGKVRVQVGVPRGIELIH